MFDKNGYCVLDHVERTSGQFRSKQQRSVRDWIHTQLHSDKGPTQKQTPRFIREFLLHLNLPYRRMSPSEIVGIQNGKVPEDLEAVINPVQASENAIKAFLFIEGPFKGFSRTFMNVQRELKDSHLNFAKRVSVYLYFKPDLRGTLVKADVGTFAGIKELSDIIDKIKSPAERTSTYLAVETLIPETDACPPSKLSAQPAQIAALRSLLLSHDSQAPPEGQEASARDRQFFEVLWSFFDHLFHYGDRWNHFLTDLKALYSWIVSERSEPFIGFLMKEYVRFESQMRQVLIPLTEHLRGGILSFASCNWDEQTRSGQLWRSVGHG